MNFVYRINFKLNFPCFLPFIIFNMRLLLRSSGLFSLKHTQIVAPNVTTPRTLFGSYVESDVTIECIVEAFPLPVNYWIKGTKSLKAYDIDNYYNANSMNHNSIGTVLTEVPQQQQQQPITGSKDEIISLR